jgi:maltose alpha-D-glucosyltransferase / alpha-amylase
MHVSSDRDPRWYKDAVIYQLHVKTFFDGNSDGIGDFAGLTAKLDYLAGLRITCLWLLPFCDSPLRDDGYDVAHYERVQPAYGTIADFDRFVSAAHDRGLRVIAELVLNHTSDRHPWFQAARRAPAGSSKRNFYVWSDTEDRFRDARVIFRDAERSNWTWDATAQAYYWHRFFHHQPDLNFDNPRVRRAILKVVRFWLDRGVDGLRLDAIPHLFEREGTTCENLPETHAFLKELRADIDARYGNRVLLAEANVAPADLRRYFGGGDECQMAFNFPLLPRLFLALACNDAALIVDGVRETVDIPDACQWALFLRNHDELSLSAVSAADRDDLLAVYAPEPRMRLNRGIRRRLAPLLGNDRARIDLAFALLLSLPGTPVIYYGDEIGMGDDVRRNDRDGLRTPMQWNAGWAGGFSTGDAVRIISPPLHDEVYGYQDVNVAAQADDPSSLLSRIRRLLETRRCHPAFGRGSIEFLKTDNARVLAFVRRWQDDTVVVVMNLAATPEPVAIEVPPEMAAVSVIEAIDGVLFSSFAGGSWVQTIPPQACWWLAPMSDARLPPSLKASADREAHAPHALNPALRRTGSSSQMEPESAS